MQTAARRVLADGMHGTVLATFRRCFYIEDDAGGLACIGNESIGAGPLNATVRGTGDFQVPAVRTPAWVDGATLYIGDRLVLDLTGATDWLPNPVPANWTTATVSAGLDFLAGISRNKLPGDGLGRLIPVLIDARQPRAEDFDFPIGRLAQTPINKLRTWVEGEPPAEACGLVGLGPGLTPSGDDFLGGMLIALRALGRDDMADQLGDLVLPIARKKTGKISAAHLSCACTGMGAAALHGLIGAIMTGDLAAISCGLDDVGDIGHSSGWDATAGAVCALTMTTTKTWRNTKC